MKEEIKYKGPRFDVVQKIYKRQDGLEYIRDCVNPGNAVVILPINKKNEVVFVKQYREVIGKTVLELPAGMIDNGEKAIDAAKRELEEETGIIAKNIEFLTSYYSSCGYTSEQLFIYVAKDFSYGEQHLDTTEEILDIEKININECVKRVIENEFDHASSKIAILTYYYKYCNGGENGKFKTNDNINRFE
jgi:ADP-ribose pyrophosphatase